MNSPKIPHPNNFKKKSHFAVNNRQQNQSQSKKETFSLACQEVPQAVTIPHNHHKTSLATNKQNNRQTA